MSPWHPLLLVVSTLTPEQSTQQMYKSLHEMWIWLFVTIGLMIVSAIVEKLTHLIEPLQELGVHIKFWPTFIVLVALATVLAGPDIHEYAETGHLIYANAHVQTVEMDGLNEMITSDNDNCKMEEAQWKLYQAQAEALDELGQKQQADQVRNAQTFDPGCPMPSPLPE